jgi:hypothetical protein
MAVLNLLGNHLFFNADFGKWGENVLTYEITLQFVKDLGNMGTNIKRQQCIRLSIYEIIGECGNKLSLKKEFRAFGRVKSE